MAQNRQLSSLEEDIMTLQQRGGTGNPFVQAARTTTGTQPIRTTTPPTQSGGRNLIEQVIQKILGLVSRKPKFISPESEAVSREVNMGR